MRNLPASPAIVSTGMAATTLGYVPWTRQLAVEVLPSVPAFRVMNHSVNPVVVTTVPSPVPLTTPPIAIPGSAYHWGPTSGGDFAGIGPGADGTVGTSDDQLVFLRQTGLGLFQVDAVGLPAWAQPEGLVFNQAGAMAFWNSASLPAINASVVMLDAAGEWPEAYATFTLSPAAVSTQAPPLMLGDPGDSFRAAVYDDLAQGYHYRFINDATTGPTLSGSYSDGSLTGTSILLAENEIATYGGQSPGTVLCRRFSLAGVESVSIPVPVDPVGYLRPHPGSLAIFLQDGRVVVASDLMGAASSVILGGTGAWHGDPVGLSPGRVAAFLRTSVLPNAPPSRLEVITTPGTPVVGLSAGFPFKLRILPTVPQLNLLLRLQGFALDPGYSGPAELLFSWNQSPALALASPLFAPGSIVHLDFASLALVTVLPMSGGFGEIVVDPLGLPAGFHLFVQAAFFDPAVGVYFVSDARLVVVS